MIQPFSSCLDTCWNICPHVTFYLTDRAPPLSHPGRSTRRCWCRQTDIRGRSSPTRCYRTSGRSSWRRKWRWTPLCERGRRITLKNSDPLRRIHRKYFRFVTCTHRASLNGQFCPLGAPTRCSPAAQPAYPESWQSISCRRCWSRRWSPGCSPPCCGGTCCWSAYSRQTCTWTSLRRIKERLRIKTEEVNMQQDIYSFSPALPRFPLKQVSHNEGMD